MFHLHVLFQCEGTVPTRWVTIKVSSWGLKHRRGNLPRMDRDRVGAAGNHEGVNRSDAAPKHENAVSTEMNLFFYRVQGDRDVDFTDMERAITEQRKASDASDSAVVEQQKTVLRSTRRGAIPHDDGASEVTLWIQSRRGLCQF
jgi:hypothetical protein